MRLKLGMVNLVVACGPLWVTGSDIGLHDLKHLRKGIFECIQVGSKDSQVKTQLVLWIFILFKATTCFGLYHQAIIRSQVNNRF